MQSTSAPPVLCPTKRALMRALWYFEIFQHPLTREELYRFADCPGISSVELTEKLEELVADGAVFQFGAFFQTKNDFNWVRRRHEYNQRADVFMPVARRMTRLIGSFPFIRAVFVSGSLSKHCVPPDGDIDYFLITEPGRLWLARTFLVIYKKLFLLNSHKYFCVNYFIDTEHLEIEDKNLFTATETLTLLPLYGREWFEKFSAANGWAKTYLPNCPWNMESVAVPHKIGVLKQSVEWLLGGWAGSWLDMLSMRLTVAYWRRKFRHFDNGTFDNALRSRRYVSKHHPLYFQRKVMTAYTERIREAEKRL